MQPIKHLSFFFIPFVMLVACSESEGPTGEELTKASASVYNQDIRKATTSRDLSKADLAWHAQNTYGWDCAEVASKRENTSSEYFIIECASGKKLRVYMRDGKHPKITNESGGYN
ncbi:hypothetical protein [Candidatus Spongiihabitans sp.]|uniref:hypothetical protein n=1 Tax=Candidatus Spongiihabitans sp. TaxID=3101308 RepID=UPI003C7A1276